MHNGAIMPSEVAHRVDTGDPYPVVRLTGLLDAEAAPLVRSALLTVLADQPEAVVVDVSDLDLSDPDASVVLRDLADLNAAWPDAHIVLCAGRDAERWHATGLPVWPDRAEALAELGAPEAGRRLSLHLEPVVGAARRARELVTEACGRWDRAGLAGPACIVVTEMVNNVVAHAGTPMIVLLANHAGTMSVAVRDRSAVVPKYTGGPVSLTSYGGRGLLLIDSVSSRWGTLELAGGKVVWALLPDEEPSTGLIHRAGMADPARG
jgi:anti-anti-sigma regulatory factor